MNAASEKCRRAPVGLLLEDRCRFLLDESQWAEFQRLLNRSVVTKPRLRQLLTQPCALNGGQSDEHETAYEALGAIHETMQALHQIDAVDRETMNDIETACLTDAKPLLQSEQQAADYLNVSVSFLRQQVQAGELACADQPGGLFLNRHDVVAYKQGVDAQRRQALDELAEQAQELDMGYGVR